MSSNGLRLPRDFPGTSFVLPPREAGLDRGLDNSEMSWALPFTRGMTVGKLADLSEPLSNGNRCRAGLRLSACVAHSSKQVLAAVMTNTVLLVLLSSVSDKHQLSQHAYLRVSPWHC